jgi:hypothetical protein
MQFKTQLDAIFNKKMDRQGFLKHIALGATALVGLGGVLRLLSEQQSRSASTAVSDGYGSSPYGGSEEAR